MSKKNKTWERNHILILEAQIKLTESLARVPTHTEIALECKLSRNSVQKHVHATVLEDYTEQLKVYAPEILQGIIRKAKSGDGRAAKLYYQLVYSWSEKKTVEHEGSIQITNLDLSKLTDDQLKTLSELRARGEDIKPLLIEWGVAY